MKQTSYHSDMHSRSHANIEACFADICAITESSLPPSLYPHTSQSPPNGNTLTGAALELLVRGADPRLRNGDGETGLQSALANGRTECAELVRDFLRRPTFEPDEGPPQSPPPQSQNISSTETITTAQEVGVAAGIGGVAAVAPEVCRANTVFCLGRRRRRLGARVRHGRGLGVGVGTAAAEVGLGARRAARLHATNPCHGTPMEAFVLWSIASGQDPFHGEGRGDGGGGGGGGEEEDWGGREGKENAEEGKGSAGVWLDYYVRVYNARCEQCLPPGIGMVYPYVQRNR